MGKNANPKVTTAPRNHMENQIFLSAYNFTILHSGFHLGHQTFHSIAYKVGVAKLYKFFHWHLKVK